MGNFPNSTKGVDCEISSSRRMNCMFTNSLGAKWKTSSVGIGLHLNQNFSFGTGMMLSWSWTSSSSIKLPQSTITTGAGKPPISIALSSTEQSPNAHPPSSKFPFPSSRRSNDRALSSCPASSSSVEEDNSASASAKLFLKGLARSTTEGPLRKAFSEFGEVTRVKIVRDKESEQSLGYGFIWFSSKEAAHLAVKEMNGKVYPCHICETWASSKTGKRSALQVLSSSAYKLEPKLMKRLASQLVTWIPRKIRAESWKRTCER